MKGLISEGACYRNRKSKQAKTGQIKIRFAFTFNLVKGAVSRNSAKLENYKMPVELRET